MSSIPRVALAFMLSIVFLVQSFGGKISATPSGAAFSQNESETVITLPVGKESGEIAYLEDDAYVVGPTDFCVINSNEFYILNSNKNEVIYVNNDRVSEIYHLSFCKKPTRLSFFDGKLYILDRSSLFIMCLSDYNVDKVDLPNNVRADNIKIFEVSNSHVYLQTYSGIAYDLFEGESSIVSLRNEVSIQDDRTRVRIDDQEWSFEIANAFINVIGAYNDAIYVFISEFSKEEGNLDCLHSIRKYSKDGALLGFYQLETKDLICMSPMYYKLGAEGEVFILECYKNEVRILRDGINTAYSTRSFVEVSYPCITENTPPNSKSTPPAVTISRNVVKARANSMKNQTWYLEQSSTVEINSDTWLPKYIKDMIRESNPTYPVHMTGDDLKGIPYCWGGFNGYSANGTTLPLKKFSDAITTFIWSSRYPMAGNVKSVKDGAPAGYKGGTVGLDCSGFVSSAFGYTEKKSANDFKTDTINFITISQYSDVVPMDIFVRSDHVMLVYAIEDPIAGVFSVVDATKTLEGRVCLREDISYTYLQNHNYIMRRPKSWHNCSHENHGSTYYSNLSYHWNKCLFCNANCNYEPHEWVYIGSNGYRCTVCGKTAYDIILPRSSSTIKGKDARDNRFFDPMD